MPDDFGDLAVNTRVHTRYPMRTRGCGCAWHPAFPAPFVLKGRRIPGTARTQRAARMRRCIQPSLRGAKATKQSSFPCAARWIASLALAMTEAEFANAQHP